MTPTRTASYRKTKTGEWVVFAPASALGQGATVTVTKKDGTTKTETVESVGRSFVVDGVAMAYGYLAAKVATPARSTSFSPRRRRSCITGGNCSSFGSSRSCGADDCDGF